MNKINKPLVIPLLIVLLIIVIFLFVSSTLSSVFIFIPGIIISYIVYLKSFYKKTPDPQKILPIYLLALGFQFLHFTEEYLTDFPSVLPALFGQKAYPTNYWLVFNMVAYFVFILGGIVLFKQIKELMIIPLFFIIVGVIFNSIAHIMLSIYVGGYFSGLYTSIVYLFIGPILIKIILEVNKTLNVVRG